MINGGHVIIYSKDAAADRAFIKDVLKFPFVDVHNGWLIFKLPPAEVAVHPSDENDLHEFYLMTDDLELEIRSLKKAGVTCDAVTQQSWVARRAFSYPAAGRSVFTSRGINGPSRSLDLEQILADNDPASEVRSGRVNPHLVRDRWIVRRHEVRQDERLDAGRLRDAARILRSRVMRQDALLQ
jgi:hypothetical protein